ncbi:MAG TPA: ATP-binding protein [Candidatus Binatia bacterium]|nr:ATP-binding protein [Candidatus Binatia bacterium]
MALVLPDHDDETRNLLAGRLRAGLLLILVGITAVTLSDPVAHRDQVRQLYPIHAVELAFVLGGLWLVRFTTRPGHVVLIAFTVVSVLCFATALSGIVVGDSATTPVLLLVLTLGTATLLPWGLWPQLALQVVATLAILWNADMVGGLESAATMPVAVVVGAVVALYGASDAARYHRERRRAEQAEAEVRARKHQAELARAARLSTLGGMAAGLAHEINQPLAAIVSYARGCARRLRSGDARPEALLEILESIAAQGLRAAAVLRCIRDFVRHSELSRERIDLGTLVREALHFAEVEGRQLGVAVRLELSPTPLEVEVDPVQIEQVILNLVRNGFEATATRAGAEGDGREQREVVIRTLRAAGGAQAAVSDTGSGISPEVAARLFEPFFTTKHDGLGLGLSISRSIVEAHDGRLWASTDSPRGATFHVELPQPLGARGAAA